MIKVVSGAVQADADLCNALDPPTSGCSAGDGIHVVIPDDWQARIAAGQDVPGCSYAQVQPDGSLYVSEQAQVQLATPSEVAKLPAKQQGQVPALAAKLAVAVPTQPTSPADPVIDQATK